MLFEKFGETIEQYICVQSLNMSRADEEKFTAFQRHLTVTAERETRLIKVVFTAPDPEVAAKVANAVVSEYLNRDADQVLKSERPLRQLAARAHQRTWVAGRQI